jgi:hypothetical protein
MYKKIVMIIFLTLIISSFSFAGEKDKNLVRKSDELSLTEHVLGSFNTSEKKKSPFLAVVYSLILPGAGEYYTNRFDVGKYSFAGEVGLWILYTGMNIHGYQVRNDGRSFARLHAGFNDENKNDNYYVDVSNFMNIYDFNDKKLRDRNSIAIYDPNSIMAWQWDSDANRSKFRDMRVNADDILNNTKFVVAAMIANRIFSAVNAARLTSGYNSNLSVSMAPTGFENRFDGFTLNFSTDF